MKYVLKHSFHGHMKNKKEKLLHMNPIHNFLNDYLSSFIFL